MRTPTYTLLTTMSAGVALLTACTRTPAPSVDPTPRARDVVPAPMDSTSTGTAVLTRVYQPGTVRYVYRSISTVQSISGDSVPRMDSTRVTALFTATFSESPVRESVRVVSRVDSLQLTTMSPNVVRSSTPEIRPSREDTLEIERVTGKIKRAGRQPSACSQDTQEPFFRGDEMTPVIPQRAAVRKSWADTTVHQTCRGGLVLEIRQIARYRLLDNSQSDLDRQIIRVMENQITGTGTQWEQPVEANGRGVAVDTLVITGTNSRLHTITGSARTEIEFRSARR